MRELTIKEIIEYAIRIEKESFNFYNNAAKIVEDVKVKDLVSLLANEEINHQNRLEEILSEENGSSDNLYEKEEIDVSVMDKIVNNSEINPDSTSLEVLETALGREKNTEQTYAMLSTLSNISQEIIDIFDYLRLQEKGHVNKIQSRINKIN